ncbi:MAG TPA: hypothetical protein ENK18_14170 [Deltaproteobacteria bacterium]|nr:hypothetical protein [Deltaproteobacteria bacterium]
MWELAVRRLEVEGGQGVEVLLVAEEGSGPLAAEPLMSPADVSRRVVELMLGPPHGSPRRPRQIQIVGDDTLRRRVARAIKGSGISVVVHSTAEQTEALMQSLVSMMLEPEVCGLSVEPDRFRAVLSALLSSGLLEELASDLGVSFEGAGLDEDLLVVQPTEDGLGTLVFAPGVRSGDRAPDQRLGRLELRIHPTRADPSLWMVDALRRGLVIGGRHAPLLIQQRVSPGPLGEVAGCDEDLQHRLLLALEATVAAMPDDGFARQGRGWREDTVQTPGGEVAVRLFAA